MVVSVTIERDEITAALTRVNAALANPQDVFEDFGQYLVRSTKKRFTTGSAPDGSVWAPKSPVTLARYPGSTQPLIGESKTLSTTISAAVFPDRVEWGSDRLYAAMQQFGGTRSQFPNLWGDIPARPFLGLSPEDETALLDICAEWLENAAAAGA